MGLFNNKDEKMLRQPNAPIVIDRSRRHKYAIYTLAKDGISSRRGGFVTLKVFPATVSQKLKDGKILPENDFKEPLEIEVNESQIDQYGQGDWDAGRQIIEILPIRVDEAGISMKNSHWYKDREPLLRKIESQDMVLESVRQEIPNTYKKMQELMSNEIKQSFWDDYKQLLAGIQELQGRLNQTSPRPENKPIEGQRTWQ